MPAFCHRCGSRLQADAQFCGGCGTGVASSGPSIAYASAPSPSAQKAVAKKAKGWRLLRLTIGVSAVLFVVVLVLANGGQKPATDAHLSEQPSSPSNTVPPSSSNAQPSSLSNTSSSFPTVGAEPDSATDGSQDQPTAEVKPVTVPQPDQTAINRQLTECLLPVAQYGDYSSYDGGKSAGKLVNEECLSESEAWMASCQRNGDTQDGCFEKVLILAQAAIKSFGK